MESLATKRAKRFTWDDKRFQEEIRTKLEHIYNLQADDLLGFARERLGSRLESLDGYLKELDSKQLQDALRASLLLFTVSREQMVPREMQLDCLHSMAARKNSMVNASTGSGKTIAMLLPILLEPEGISLVISPLKQLQTNQVTEFAFFGIATAAINSDTPQERHAEEFWARVRQGDFPIIIVSPESFGPFEGGRQMPRFASMLSDNYLRYGSRISRVFVDEAHFIYTSGVLLHGAQPSRRAYGKLGDAIRLRLPKNTPVQALSGTLPQHIKWVIQATLHFGPVHTWDFIKYTSNRSNITYVFWEVMGSLNTFENLNFIFPLAHGAKILIYFDDINQVAAATTYLQSFLSQEDRIRGVVREYHSEMSDEYRRRVYQEFSCPDGNTRVLLTMSACAVGVDISNVTIVIQWGVCCNIPDWRQRGGRVARSPGIQGLYITFVESWVKGKVPPDEIDGDPDTPLVSPLPDKAASKHQRVGSAMIKLVKNTSLCVRDFLAAYFDDTTLERTLCTNMWCCDRHPANPIDYSRWFTGSRLTVPPPAARRVNPSDRRDPKRPEGERKHPQTNF
ncbi:P-loop containing nucleoside triphosphate hydrolase protein [Coniophora puteana RWD-64-598 SS2]|uniref:DNA 3'-5' helicase n=1 Tax=Coniophora puteana (strain RWD-64-598) TaxID=741705 RepID=A0A5M3MKA2_CONPW|nr:P-loop containing nucleoside triphosphate hydrolase protein [Coniophora puteana RWD-64-598 SS2]EIW79496.1 P-loop containing nucleoside triphosphate hydrolase protein [Coniophora puteana RWD-64-598 SS2]